MRPQRLYKTDKGKYYFIIDGIRKYIRIPKGMTESELMKLNTKTILKLYGKRKKPRKKRKLPPKLEKPIINGPLGQQLSISGVSNQPTASTRFVQQEKPIVQIEEIITASKTAETARKAYNKLVELAGKSVDELFKGTQLIENSKTIAKPIQADTTTDNIDIIDTPIEIEEVIKRSVSDVNEMDSLWKNPSLVDRMTETKLRSYKAFLNRAINSTEPDEDVKKKLYQKFSENKELINEFEKTYKKWMETNPEIDETSPTPNPYETPPPKKPTYSKPSRGNYEAYLKQNTSGLMPSNRAKPKTTAQKLQETPSYSGSTQGTDKPASPMPVSVYEQAKAEYYANLSPEERAREEAKAQMGFGVDDGLYNDEIAKIIRKRVGKIIPVIPSDKVNELLGYVSKGDKKFGAVINTNPSTSDGSGNDGFRPGHWRAIFIDNEDDYGSCEYFDPLAEGPPEKALVDVMKKLCKKINPENLCLYKQNNLRRQAKEKSTCGWHVLQFLDDRYNGVPWSEATGYDNYMKNLPQPADDSQDGEKEVSKYIKKYKVYL